MRSAVSPGAPFCCQLLPETFHAASCGQLLSMGTLQFCEGRRVWKGVAGGLQIAIVPHLTPSSSEDIHHLIGKCSSALQPGAPYRCNEAPQQGSSTPG